MSSKKKIDRLEAAKKGLTTYYTGIPCKNGHRTYRYTSDGHCIDCTKDRVYRRTNKIRDLLAKARTENADQAAE